MNNTTSIDEIPTFLLSHGFEMIKNRYKDREASSKMAFKHGSKFEFAIDGITMRLFRENKCIKTWRLELTEDELLYLSDLIKKG
jgi:hypothetical protein